jgi:hypothetical protein
MNANGFGSVVLIALGLVLFYLGCPKLNASERAEYEGELRSNIPSSSDKEPPPLIHVITKDGQVEQITLRDRQSHPNRIEKFHFTVTKVTRYQIISAVTGQPTETHDLSRDTTLRQSERERIIRGAELLLRHFRQKGG